MFRNIKLAGSAKQRCPILKYVEAETSKKLSVAFLCKLVGFFKVEYETTDPRQDGDHDRKKLKDKRAQNTNETGHNVTWGLVEYTL